LNELEIYTAVRNEILSNHILMHWFSIIIALSLLIGILMVELRKSILSVFLPLLSISWAASMVRFDFFIHRQAAYLRTLESQMRDTGVSIPLWESWKASLRATQFVIPIADTIACTVIVIPTIYLLFGPSRQFFRDHRWKGGKAYAWAASILLLLLLCFLAAIPKIADWK